MAFGQGKGNSWLDLNDVSSEGHDSDSGSGFYINV